MKLSAQLRELLRSKRYSAGATVTALSGATGALESGVRRALYAMPDTYIADWKVNGTKPAQVWRVVVPPPHCPPPPKGRTK